MITQKPGKSKPKKLDFTGFFASISKQNHVFTVSFLLAAKPFGILLHKLARNHDLMTAAHTFQAEIRTYTEDFHS